jgi:hypothetical protein
MKYRVTIRCGLSEKTYYCLYRPNAEMLFSEIVAQRQANFAELASCNGATIEQLRTWRLP